MALHAPIPDIVIDLSDIRSREDLHALLMRSLDAPELCGNDWDAFWEAITATATMPQRLILTQWEAFENRLPCDASVLRQLLDARSEECPETPCEVVYRP